MTALQEFGGETSDQSDPVPVLGLPATLPRLELETFPSTLLSTAIFRKTLSGATVYVRNAQGQDVAKGIADASMVFADFNLSTPLHTGEQLSAVQVIGDSISVEELTPPLVNTADKTIADPALSEPLMACAINQTFLAAAPAAITDIINVSADGSRTEKFFYVNPSPSFEGMPSPPLAQGTLYVTQKLPRLDLKSGEVKYEVVPRTKPNTPSILNRYCYLVEKFKVSGLEPGATVFFEVDFFAGPQGQIFGIGGAQYIEQDFKVPRELFGTGNVKSFRVKQTICGIESDWSAPVEDSPSADAKDPPPRIVEQVYDCVNILRVKDTRVGYEVQAYDADTGRTLSAPVVAGSDSTEIALWGELASTKTKRVRVHHYGCTGDYNVFADVHDVTDPLQAPTIDKVLRPGQRSIKVRDCIIGAWIELFVKGIFRCRAKATDFEMTLALPGTESLPADGKAFARQRLCAHSADSFVASIYKGKLYGKFLPEEPRPGYGVTVQAIDEFEQQVTGLPVQLTPNYQSGLVSGGSFLVPGYGDLPDKVLAKILGEPSYNDVELTILLAPPEPPPAQALGLHLINNEFYNAPLKITKAAWSVTFEWGGSDTKQGIDVNIEVPAFPQGTTFGRIYVSLTIDWTAQGVYGGYVIRPTSGSKLAVSNLEVGWPDPSYSGNFSVLLDWIVHQTPTEGTVEPVIAVVKDAESINN
ncbi:hypothetical protein GCM10010869_21110 [Mesorhizobium tianshanense]|nr:hypothetical protein GCM10010869_21110 [Mesorhizobium tianshanense]